PATMNWTFAAATLSEAVAVKATSEPLTIAPSEGAVIVTDGGVTSADMVGGTEGEASVPAPLWPSLEWLENLLVTGAAHTLTSMVELPRFPPTVPTTVKENASWP